MSLILPLPQSISEHYIIIHVLTRAVSSPTIVDQLSITGYTVKCLNRSMSTMHNPSNIYTRSA